MFTELSRTDHWCLFWRPHHWKRDKAIFFIANQCHPIVFPNTENKLLVGEILSQLFDNSLYLCATPCDISLDVAKYSLPTTSLIFCIRINFTFSVNPNRPFVFTGFFILRSYFDYPYTSLFAFLVYYLDSIRFLIYSGPNKPLYFRQLFLFVVVF